MYYDDELIKDPVAEDIEGSSLSVGMIIGIVCGGVIIILIILLACYKYRSHKVDISDEPERPP